MLMTLLYLIISLFCGANAMGMDSKEMEEAWATWSSIPDDEEGWNKKMSELVKPAPKQELSDTSCGTIGGDGYSSFNPNQEIAKLNGAQMVHDYPAKCKELYMNMMIEIIVNFIEDLNDQRLLDIEIMKQEILALRTEKNKDAIDKVLEKIKNLKEK